MPLFPGFEEYTGKRGLVCCGYAPSTGAFFLNHIPSYERERRIRDEGDESVIVFDAPWMEGGHSGGPVFGEGGGVVAVLLHTIRPDNGERRGRATSILELLRYLRFECS
jgi:hypothetical protein